VVQSVPLLDRAAMEAVGRWIYAPTRLNGQPVAVVMNVTVRFTLGR
jgi:protein TonB